MGLDQYGYAVMPSGSNTDFHVEWDTNDNSKVHRIAQWRKHANLQKYMEDLYVSKIQEQGLELPKTEMPDNVFMTSDPKTGEPTPLTEVLSGEDLDRAMSEFQELVDQETSKFTEERVVFNQQPLRLNSKDLDDLETCVKEGKMPLGEGPFWGESSQEDDEQTLKFVEYARRCIAEGLEVYYDSWW